MSGITAYILVKRCSKKVYSFSKIDAEKMDQFNYNRSNRSVLLLLKNIQCNVTIWTSQRTSIIFILEVNRG